MGKKTKLFMIILYTVIVVGITMYFNLRTNEAVTYVVDVIADDFIVRDFTLVTFKNKYYITNNTRVEKRSLAKNEIKDCFLEISQDGEILMSSGFSFQTENILMSDIKRGVDYYELFNDKLSSKEEKIMKGKDIQVKFNYTIEGIKKEDIQYVKLEEFIKYKF